MKQSELNHLRRLLGWVKCEIGQEPQAMVAMLTDIADKLGNPPLDDGAKRRLVEGYEASQRVPKYIREAVKALEKLTGPGDDIGDAEPTLRKLDHTASNLSPARLTSTMTPEQAKEQFLRDRWLTDDQELGAEHFGAEGK